MTAEEFLRERLDDWSVGVEEALIDFTRIKCKEVLEIAAKKAKTKEEYLDPFLKPDTIADKDSI